jgi:hypothetical protein
MCWLCFCYVYLFVVECFDAASPALLARALPIVRSVEAALSCGLLCAGRRIVQCRVEFGYVLTFIHVSWRQHARDRPVVGLNVVARGVASCFVAQLNIANPSTGAVKVLEVDEEKQLYVCWTVAVLCSPLPHNHDEPYCRPSLNQ